MNTNIKWVRGGIALAIIIFIGAVNANGEVQRAIKLRHAKQEALVDAVEQPGKEKTAYIWKMIGEYLGRVRLHGITTIDVIPGELEMDSYNRYFASFKVLGVDETEDIEVYDYYMIMQRDEEGLYHIMPFGIEVMEESLDEGKKEVFTTALKVANGWGTPFDTIHQRWQEKIPTQHESEHEGVLSPIYEAQSLMTFIDAYITDWLQAIECKEPVGIEKYYGSNVEEWEENYQLFQAIVDSGVHIELYELQILDIVYGEEGKSFEITVHAEVQVEGDNEVYAIAQKTVYTVAKTQEGFVIVNELIDRKQ